MRYLDVVVEASTAANARNAVLVLLTAEPAELDQKVTTRAKLGRRGTASTSSRQH